MGRVHASLINILLTMLGIQVARIRGMGIKKINFTREGGSGCAVSSTLLHEQRRLNGEATCKGGNVMVTWELKLLSDDYVMRVGVGTGATGYHVVHVR